MNGDPVLTDRVIWPDGMVSDILTVGGRRKIGKFILVGQVERRGLKKNLWVYDDIITLTPTTALHKAYYRVANNQTGAPPVDPSWAEITNTEFSTANYSAVQSDDATRTSRTSSATIVGRWCAACEIFTFDLSTYSNISNIEFMWDGYVAVVANFLASFFVKTAAATWTDKTIPSTLPTSDGTGWEVDGNDTTCFLATGIYKVSVFVIASKVAQNETGNIYTDALQIIVTYVPAATGKMTVQVM